MEGNARIWVTSRLTSNSYLSSPPHARVPPQTDYIVGAIRRIDLPSGAVSTLATGFSDPIGIAVDPAGTFALVVSCPEGGGVGGLCVCPKVLSPPPPPPPPTPAPQADYTNMIIRIEIPSGDMSTIAGAQDPGFMDGVGTAASFFRPTSIALYKNGNSALVVSIGLKWEFSQDAAATCLSPHFCRRTATITPFDSSA